MRALIDDKEANTRHAWTSIPDWVTKVLKEKGYDGIKDTGGKYGGTKHSVWIPFDDKQVKSAISNTGAFSKTDPRMQYATKKSYIDFGGKDNVLSTPAKRDKTISGQHAGETRKLQTLLAKHGHQGVFGIRTVEPIGKERQAVQEIAKSLGTNAVFFQASNFNIGFNGVVFPENPNTVYINTDSTTPFLVVIGHEITHTLEKNHPDLYKQYMDLMANNTLKFDDYLNGLNILREDFGMPTVSPLEAYKELLADFAGDQFTNPEFYEALHAADPSFAKRFVNILKRVLTKIAHAAKSVFGTEKYIKDIKQGQEVLSVVLKEYASRESGGKSKAIREGMPLFQVQAFHGSPHVVDKFSTDKIGTGEGVQAFGWGLYFTELEDIARHYAGSNIGTESIFKYDGVELTHPSLDNRSENLAKWGIASLIKKGRSPNVAKTQEAAFLERNIRDGFIESQKILDALKDIDPSKIQIITTGRNLYKVTLHKGKEPGDYVWLDWDKALPDAQQKEIGRHIDKEYSPGEFKDKIRSAIRKDDNFVVTINGETTAGFQSLVEANSFLQKNDKGNPKYKWEVSAKQGEIGRRIYRRLSNVLGSDKQASLFLLRAGIDGIRYPAGSLSGMKDTGAKNYVVFDENAVTIESHAQYSTKQKESAAMQAESQLDAFRRKFQDQYLPLKRTEEFLESQGSEIGDRSPYLLEELHTSKAQAKLEELEDRLIRPFMEDLRKSKVSVEEMEQYRYAEHAPERNEYIQSINEDFEEGGSGMTDEEAQEILDDFAAEGKIEDLKRLDKWIDKIVAFQKGVIRVVGLETPDIVDAWGRYDKYIPLKGVSDENAINTFFGRKKGLGVKKSGTKRALGRQSRATDLLANLFAQTAQTVQQAEIAQIGQAFLSMVEANPNAEMWNVYKPGDKLPTKRAYVRGKVVEVPDPMWTNRGDVFPVTREGEIYYIEIKNKQLAGALNRLNQPEQGSIIQALGHLNRYLSVINTMLNLEFVITNFERDIQTAMTNLAGEQSLKLAKDTLKGVPSAMKGIHNSLRGDKKSEMAGWYKRFKFAGGQVGFMDLQSVEKKIKEIKKMSSVKRNPVTEALRYTSILGNIIGDYNTIVENAVRLSAFKTAVGAGMSEPRAASLAKNLTVNFNRKGEYGVAMNSMYLFFNAGIQGSTRIIQALGHKNVRRIVYAVTATSIALAEMSRLSGGEDDDGKDKWDKINPYLKQTNYIYLREDGSLVKIKLPYGYNVFVALGYAINDSWHYFASDKIKGMSPAAAASFMAIAAIDAFNPIGGSESLIKLISPTISDPFVDVAVNENFMGIPIKPENLQFGPKKPESELYWSSVRPISKNIAQKINELTGGDKVEPGVIDISPEVLDYFWDYATGGAGRFFADTAGTAVSLAKGEEQKTNRIPFVRKVIQDPNEYFDLQEFRKNSDKAIAYYNSEKGIASSKDRIAYEKRHPEIKLHNQAKVYQKEMSRLRNAQREAEGKKEEKRAKEFETRMRKTAMEFNKKFYDITIKKQAR
ncbi:MAG: hypothetical protein KKD77_24540 [Gammaproteobacteria bacterium]|nr:hypothetical protein [Gammaproteobacteria bacterium]